MTIGARVDGERQHLRRAELVAGVLLASGAIALLLAAGAAALGGARWLALPRALPFVVWAAMMGAAAWLWMHTRRRLREITSRREVALAIEREQGLRRGVLVGALELDGRGALAARAAASAGARLPSDAPLAPALRRRTSRRALAAAGIAAAGALLLGSATPLFGDGLKAVLQPVSAWRGSLLARPRIDGAPAELLRGAPLTVQVVAPGRRSVMLSVRATGDAWRTDTLLVDPHTGRAAWTLDAIRGDVRLVASDGRAMSDSVVVHVADRPFVGAVTLRARYPAYLERASDVLPVGEPLRLPWGTTLVITGRASVPLASLALVDARGGRHALAVHAQQFDGQLLAMGSMSLRWIASAADARIADVPPPLDIEVIPDSVPRVDITAPAVDTLVVSGDMATLSITASDDHGLRAVELRVMRGESAAEAGATRAIATAVGTSWAGDAAVEVGALRLQAGESARVRAEAVEASPWARRGTSRELVLKRPTLGEQRELARALGDSAAQQARSLATAQRSLAQRTDEAARTQGRLGGQKPMSFEAAEKARALAQEQRAMGDRVEALRRATQQLEQQLKAAGALDTALGRQLREAQALLRQALTPQLMAQMQKLESAAQQMRGDPSRDAMRELAAMQQRMREQLERSAEMLKRAAHEGAMQTLGDQAAELADRERALGEREPVQPPRADAARLAEQAQRLKEQMQGLEERLRKDGAESGASKTGAAKQHAGSSADKLRQAPEPAPREAAREMDAAAKSMRDARSAQVQEWKQELTAELDQAVQEMLQLAREERALEQQTRSGETSADRRGQQSAVEQGVDKAGERLRGAGRKSALLSPRSERAVGDAKEKVAQATQKVAQPNGSPTQQAGALGEAADALTKAAASLARDRERANSASSASGFSEMLQQMQEAAQKQGQVNSQAQGLMAMPGGANGPGAQQLARALAKAQRGIADQLEDVGESLGGERAAQLAREARQLADQLDGGRLDGSTLARQQQLFRRLLDAGRSMEKEERDDSQKREATAARSADGFTPSGAVTGKPATRFRPPTWDELRGLSAEERRAILDYFTRLNSGPQR